MRSFPFDVVVLESDGLLHARFARGKRLPLLVQAKTYRLPAETFTTSVVTPLLTSPESLAEVIRRLRAESGRWDKVSLLLPDSWFRMNVLELPSFQERQSDAAEVVRWSLKRTLPIPPQELRLAYEVTSRNGDAASLLVVSAMEKTLAAIESAFAAQGAEVVLIEPLGLSMWNAISAQENGTSGDRLFVYIREDEFTTAVFRNARPLFLRSRNLSQDRPLQQEIRLSASYLRDALQTERFARCYVAGDHDGSAAAAISGEFSSPVTAVRLSDFVEGDPAGVGAHGAELTACTGVFTA